MKKTFVLVLVISSALAALQCHRSQEGKLTVSSVEKGISGETGTVTKVMDGDTLMLKAARDVKVRLARIDAPEKSQMFGAEAKEALSSMVSGKVVRVSSLKADMYGRTVAEVYCGTGMSVNAKMVESGLAWQYLQYDKGEELSKLQDKARAEKKGLWVQQFPEPPWQYRKKHKREMEKESRNE